RIDLGRRVRRREIADARDEPVHDADVRAISWQACPVEDRPVSNDHVKSIRLCTRDGDKDTEANSGHKKEQNAAAACLPLCSLHTFVSLSRSRVRHPAT